MMEIPEPFVKFSRLDRVTETALEAKLPGSSIGDMVKIGRDQPIFGEIVALEGEHATVIPLSKIVGISTQTFVRQVATVPSIPASPQMFGRVVDSFGKPLDGKSEIVSKNMVPVHATGPELKKRVPVRCPFSTGIRAIDGLLTLGLGQRVGIFAGAGVGKTTLIRQMAKQSEADVKIIGLIGERGCEVTDFAASELDDRTIVVAATADRSPMERVFGARAATALAEHYRTQGKNVLLILDSLTRYAMALREIGLSVGEPPATKGYPASVFAALPRLLERVAPLSDGGSITGVYTVLVEGDDLSDPVADSARSLLDGHVVLSRDIAARGRFPAISVLESASRVALNVQSAQHRSVALRTRAILAQKQELDELMSIGGYVQGKDERLDAAVLRGQLVEDWMSQSLEEHSSIGETLDSLKQLSGNGAP